jgi:hypothetical protein
MPASLQVTNMLGEALQRRHRIDGSYSKKLNQAGSQMTRGKS